MKTVRICLVLLLLSVFLFAVCITSRACIPEGGTWYCSELKIQLAFDKGNETYAILNGRKVHCIWENDLGSAYISVLCQEHNIPDYEIGEAIFSGKFVELSDCVYTLEDTTSGTVYLFVKID